MPDVRIAQIGVGYWGKNLARNLAQLGHLVAVSDFHEATAARVAAEHKVPARSVEEILSDSTIDGVSIATPAVTHAGLAVRALEAGKHVFVEKPLALSRADAKRAIAASDQVSKALMVGHLLQYHPIFVRLTELVENGDLGQIRYVYSNRLGLGKYRTEENVLWSFSPHDISMILALIGAEPDRVIAEGAAFVTAGVADWTMTHLQFASGVRAHVQASWSHPFKEHRLVVVGDLAMAVFEDSAPEWNKRLAIYRHRIDRSGSEPIPVKAEAEFIEVPPGEPLRLECEHFVQCIATGARPRTDGREGMRVLEVLERAEASLQERIKGG